MARDIRRTVKLILDKLSAKRVEKEIGDALDKGTDAKVPVKNLKKIEGGLSKIKALALAAGAAIIAFVASKKVFNFLKESTELAAENEEAWTKLAVKVEKAGVSYNDVEEDLRGMSDAMLEAIGLGRDDYADVLGTLLDLTNNYALSVQNLDLVMDFAAATGKSFVQSAEAIGKALQGDTRLLKELNIEWQAGTDIVEVLRERLDGFSEKTANTLSGKLRQLSGAWRNFKVEIGEALIESGAGQSVLDALTGSVQDLTRWVRDNREVISAWGDTMAQAFEKAKPLLQWLSDRMGGGPARRGGERLNLLRAMGMDKGLITRELQAINREMGELQAALDANAALGPHVGGMFEVMGMSVDDAKDRMKELGVVARGLQAELRALGAAAEEVERVLVGGGAGEAEDPFKLGTGFGHPDLSGGAAGQGIFDDFQGITPPVNEVTHRITQEMIDAITDDIREGFAEWERFAHVAAFGIEDAFRNAFDILLEGFDNVGDAAKALAGGIAGALIGGVVDYARVEAAKEIAAAFGMLALSLNPFTPGVGGPSAAAHFASAAKWAALAGIAGAVGSKVSSAGSGGGGGSSSVSQGGTSKPIGPEITIYVDGIDPQNPRHQNLIGEIQQYTVENWGPGARIRAGRRN